MHSYSVREKARRLRLQGFSYNEINEKTGISKSTLYSWLSDMQMPEHARARIRNRVREGSLKGLIRRNKAQTHLARKRAHKCKAEGMQLLRGFSKRDLMIIGATLYWGEGYKRVIVHKGKKRTHHPVSLSNSDPYIISVFILFLNQCLDVNLEDIEICLHLYSHINEIDAITHWKKITGLKRENFGKTYYGVSIASQRKRSFNRLPFGTAQIRVNSTQTYHKIMGMIQSLRDVGLQKELLY